MKGVLIIAHGSRRESTVETMNFILGIVRENITDVKIVSSYMEFAKPSVTEGLEELKSAGVTDIIAVPYFLFDGIHIKEDIPEELEKFRKLNPDIKVTMGDTLGKDKRLADILTQRIKEAF